MAGLDLMIPSFLFLSPSSWSSSTEAMISTSTSSGSDSSYIISDIISTPPLSFTATPPSTSMNSSDFIYVDFSDYEDYSSYEDFSIPPDTSNTVPHFSTTPSTTVSTSIATTPHPRQKSPPPIVKKKTPTTPPATVPMVPTRGENSTMVPIRTSLVPEFPTTVSADPDDIITGTSTPNQTSGWRSLEAKMNLTETEPITAPSSSPSFFPLSKRENNSVDEVQYRIVGLDGDITKGQQNYFVPRMPPFRERTQNRRIQQLLNERRRQDLLRRFSQSREGRTDRRHDGL